MQVISRKEAKAAGLKRFFTGKPCKNGHIAEISVSSYVCMECGNARNKAKYHADLEKSRIDRRKYYSENSSRINGNSKKYRDYNKDNLRIKKHEYYEKIKLDNNWKNRQKERRELNKEAKREYDRKRAEEKSTENVARATLWNRLNKDRRKFILFSYDSKRRLQKKDGDSTKAIFEWEKKEPKVCYWCSTPCADKYHIDHYEPLSKGGKHIVKNLVIACPGCNLKKNAKDPYKFAKQVGRLF